ncbi:hypothetical protein [Yeosuana marina]|nr:hypothetical protein [Yeosuana marina]
MKRVNKISRRLNKLTTESFILNRRIIDFNGSVETMWIGTKHYLINGVN